MDGVERSIHYLLVSVMMPRKMRKGLISKASILSFILFLTTFLLLCQFANYAAAASSSSSLKPSHMNPHSKQLSKRPISFVPSLRPREWRTLSALNSSRNARQVPEIPALYSAPEVLTPEIPALYSAPGEINSDPNEQNDVDADPQARQATTEVTIGGEDDEEEDEASSEDYQYGVPTEKYGMSDDSNQAEEESLNEYPTDSPMPQATYLPPVSRTNDVDFNDEDNAEETTEDSYGAAAGGGGYNNDPANNEPSQQYGPPAPSPTTRKNGNGKGSNKRKMQSSSSPRRTNNSNKNNGRPSDQQQKMGNRMQQKQQPQKQKNTGYDSEPQSAYLPPVYQPPSQPIDHQDDYQQEDTQNQQQQPQQPQQESQSEQDQYNPSAYGQQPPNVNYHTLPDTDEDVPQQNDFDGSSYEPNSVDKSANGDNIHSVAQGFSEAERSKGLPDNGQQGQYFGNEQPNSVYGPPGVNHLQSHSNNRDEGAQEEELEGLNENIVDAELLERVQQIIEDHERQQKAFLERVQKDNEKAFGGGSGGGGSSGYSGPSGISSFSNENELHDGFSSRGGGSGGGSPPYTAYGPPALSNGPAGSGSNGYHNPNSIQQHKQQQSNGDRDHRSQSGNNQNKPSGSYSPPSLSSPSQNGGGYNNQRQGKHLDFQVQKAVLSRHFTETEISPGYPERKEDGYQNKNKLNSFAGPGEEYLPPGSSPPQQQQQSGYPNSFNSGNGKPEDHQNVFNVKVSAGIAVEGKPKPTSGSAANQQPSNLYGSPPPPRFPTLQNSPLSSLTSGATRSQNSQGYNARQESTFPTGRFPSELPSYQTSYPQQQNFQPSSFWSRTHPQRGTPPPQQQPRYGPPAPVENRNEKPTTSYQSNTGSGSTKNSNSDHSVGSGSPSNGDYHQRSYNSQQSQSQQHSAFQPGGFNINNGNNGVSEPRPVYGIPLAPVITLDSDNNLSNFNGNSNNVGGGGGGKEKNTYSSYSQDGNNVGQSFPVTTITSGSGPANNYYLPPSTPGSGSPSQNGEIGQHQFSSPSTQVYPQQESGSTSTNGDAPSYGLFANNPSSSSSSTYLMIQGHDGNSNNHIYNINHNGYDTSSRSFARLMSSHSSSSGAGDDASSIIPGGISNTFSLPIYDYSASHQNHHDELVGSAAGLRPVVLPFEQQHPQSVTSPGSTNSEAIYGQKTQGNFRVSRRALTRKANVSLVDNNPNQKPLTSLASNSNSGNEK